MEDNKNTELEKDVETKGKDGADTKSETTDTSFVPMQFYIVLKPQHRFSWVAKHSRFGSKIYRNRIDYFHLYILLIKIYFTYI